MGIYSHLSTDELIAKRAKYIAALNDRLTKPQRISGEGRGIDYAQNADTLRREIAAINDELTRKAGQPVRRPIYLG